MTPELSLPLGRGELGECIKAQLDGTRKLSRWQTLVDFAADADRIVAFLRDQAVLSLKPGTIYDIRVTHKLDCIAWYTSNQMQSCPVEDEHTFPGRFDLLQGCYIMGTFRTPENVG